MSDALYKIIGNKSRVARIALQMTQSDLAQALGLTRTSVTNLESGAQQMTLPMLYAMCEVLRVDIHDLLPKSSDVNMETAQRAREVAIRLARQRLADAQAELDALLADAPRDEKRG